MITTTIITTTRGVGDNYTETNGTTDDNEVISGEAYSSRSLLTVAGAFLAAFIFGFILQLLVIRRFVFLLLEFFLDSKVGWDSRTSSEV